ncbi:hypothetical protein AXG93_412s1090 [Marchantia polymorpha subsp. ruderalis]|uniref:Uncharacterized protein n=1 Tax=Marchantia polymorpha subsp. ruderalis TaxID=1480154 RepID=A0A176VMX1_MARPO|nr:hypothetical protein AXG93_412s1090 [Marchantia polymorpha subsp. ruderalis]
MASTNEDKDPPRNWQLFSDPPPPEAAHQNLPLLTSLLSGFKHHICRNALSAFHLVCHNRDNSTKFQNSCNRQLLITYLPSQKLSFSSRSPWGTIPTASLLGAPGKVSPAQPSTTDESTSTAVDGTVPASSTGPAFIGQVFTMCDASRRGLIAVRPVDSPKTKKIPYLPAFLSSKLGEWVDKAIGHVNKEDMKGPIFRFYFDKEDANTYVKQLGLAGSMVGSCPLDAAYKYFKYILAPGSSCKNPHRIIREDVTPVPSGWNAALFWHRERKCFIACSAAGVGAAYGRKKKGKPPMFRFMPDKKQVKVAKKLLRDDQGRTAARMFRGVPVFTARNLTIAMSTPSGVRWFTPYFFDKQHLDKLIGHSVDHYYHMLIHARRMQRHSQIADDMSGDQPEDDPDGLMDPPEVQEFMEEMGQGGNPIFDSVLLKAAEVQFHDMVDNVILGNRLSRQLAGLQPSFPVLVDSFERRAAAAEADLSDGPRSSIANTQLRSKVEDATRSRDSGHSDDGSSSTSGRDSADIGFSDGRVQKNERAAKTPFQLFGRNWGFHLQGGRKRQVPEEDPADEKLQAEGTADNLGSRCTETAVRKEEPIERMQPKLTMMGIAMTEPDNDMTDAVLQKAMAAAAKDIENRVRKGEGSGIEHGPLFIADLGGPPEIWGRDASSFQGWDSDDNE